jgi:hypothetical protein
VACAVGLVVARAAAASPSYPLWLLELIAAYALAPAGERPDEVREATYRGEPGYCMPGQRGAAGWFVDAHVLNDASGLLRSRRESLPFAPGERRSAIRMMRQTSVKLGWIAWLVMVAAGAMLGGCGYTDLEMAAKQRQIDVLVTQVNALKAGQGVARKTYDSSQACYALGPAVSSR